jgi:hypothetical protein
MLDRVISTLRDAVLTSDSHSDSNKLDVKNAADDCLLLDVSATSVLGSDTKAAGAGAGVLLRGSGSNSNFNDAYDHPRPLRDRKETNAKCKLMIACEVMHDVIRLSKNKLKLPTGTDTWKAIVLPQIYEPIPSKSKQRTRKM